MKKLIIVVLAALLLGGCEGNQEPVVRHATDANMFEQVVEFEYNKHQYIWFKNEDGLSWSGGIVHDPDCWCMVEYD